MGFAVTRTPEVFGKRMHMCYSVLHFVLNKPNILLGICETFIFEVSLLMGLNAFFVCLRYKLTHVIMNENMESD